MLLCPGWARWGTCGDISRTGPGGDPLSCWETPGIWNLIWNNFEGKCPIIILPLGLVFSPLQILVQIFHHRWWWKEAAWQKLWKEEVASWSEQFSPARLGATNKNMSNKFIMMQVPLNLCLHSMSCTCLQRLLFWLYLEVWISPPDRRLLHLEYWNIGPHLYLVVSPALSVLSVGLGITEDDLKIVCWRTVGFIKCLFLGHNSLGSLLTHGEECTVTIFYQNWTAGYRGSFQVSEVKINIHSWRSVSNVVPHQCSTEWSSEKWWTEAERGSWCGTVDSVDWDQSTSCSSSPLSGADLGHWYVWHWRWHEHQHQTITANTQKYCQQK